MFHPIEIPFGCVMLFNVVDLKDGVTVEDVELVLGQMSNVVKNNYGDDNGGFIGGQVFKNAGFISDEGSVMSDAADKRIRVASPPDSRSPQRCPDRTRKKPKPV